ncbi:MAG: 4Fe-4S binding protein [Anaerolineales bacterium]|nr:4Fe-4S binding protein [Anaerolineales bacterium]
MVFIDEEKCTGCGECVDVCPTDAILLQNGKAFIDISFCEGCEVCMDSCSQGAIGYGAVVPVPEKAFPVPQGTIRNPPGSISLREAVLPVIGSILLWTGRELAPRLANLAVDYLDRRLQSTESGTTYNNIQRRGRRSSVPAGGQGRRQRQRRRKHL